MADTRSEGRQRAVQLASEGKLEEALAEYQRLLTVSPLDTESRQRVAELLEWLGRKSEAATAYEAAAVAWAKTDAPLRAMAASVALSRLGVLPAMRVRATRAVAERFALAPGAPPAPDAVPIFSRLDAPAFAALLEVLEVRALFPGQTVVEEGTPGTSMFVLVEGRAEVVRTLEGGVRKVVGTVGPGDFFGEVALITEGPRLATVVATERSVLLELSRARLESVAARHPQAATVVEDFYRQRLVDNVLRTNPVFTRLTPEQKVAVARDFQLRQVAPGEALLTQGQPGDAFYVILRGSFTPWLEQPHGKRVALAVLREGDVFGEISLLLDKPVSATVRADGAGVVLRLERAAFEKHLLSQPGLKGMLMRMGTERLQHTAQVMASGRVLHEGDLRV